MIETKLSEMSIDTEDIITPWNIQSVGENGIDYDKIAEKFNLQKIDDEIIKKFEAAIGKEVHYFIKRGIIFSHRDIEKLLQLHAEKKKFYLYTGRGPSSEGLHLGHLIPLIITKWLQDTFDVPVIIQLTDDEKALFSDLKIEQVEKLVKENIKDIIAVGFNPEKTFIFSSLAYMGQTPEYYRNIIRIRKSISYGQVKNLFGFNDSDLVGRIVFPATQVAPALSTTFPEIFGDEKIQPFVVCALDQDPYFQMTRDVALKMNYPPPIMLHSIFLPSLQGVKTKMSASDVNSAIFMTDTAKQIKTKVNKYAFSGGKTTVEEHRDQGGDTEVDVSYHILRFFQPDDDELEKVRATYRSGELLSGEIKKLAIECLQPIVSAHQERKKLVTDAVVNQFMKKRKL